MVDLAHIQALEFQALDIELTHQFVFFEVGERSLQPHLEVVVDGPAGAVFAEAVKGVGGVLEVGSGDEVLVLCEPQVQIGGAGVDDVCLGVLEFGVVPFQIVLHFNLLFGLEERPRLVEVHVAEGLAEVQVDLMELLADLGVGHPRADYPLDEAQLTHLLEVEFVSRQGQVVPQFEGQTRQAVRSSHQGDHPSRALVQLQEAATVAEGHFHHGEEVGACSLGSSRDLPEEGLVELGKLYGAQGQLGEVLWVFCQTGVIGSVTEHMVSSLDPYIFDSAVVLVAQQEAHELVCKLGCQHLSARRGTFWLAGWLSTQAPSFRSLIPTMGY